MKTAAPSMPEPGGPPDLNGLPEPDGLREPGGPPDLRRLRGLGVLIVDDEEDFALALAGRLELRGLKAACAFSGEQGLELLQQALPDILLLDMRMPGLSGVDLLRRLRGQEFAPGGGKLPILIITGHCAEEDRAEAQKLGIQGYHAKPLDMEELLASMSAALRGEDLAHDL